MSDKAATRLYEAMFLVDSNRAGQDWDGLTGQIHGIITRHGGAIANSEKWDERRLAFPIKNDTKATYLLVHFNAEPGQVQQMRHEYSLADSVLRVLIMVDEDGITSEVRSLPDDPTDPVRSTRRERNVSVPRSRHRPRRDEARDDEASDEDGEDGEDRGDNDNEGNEDEKEDS